MVQSKKIIIKIQGISCNGCRGKDNQLYEKDWLEKAMSTIPCDANSSDREHEKLYFGSKVLQKFQQINSIEKLENITGYYVTVSVKDDQQCEKDWLEEALSTIHL